MDHEQRSRRGSVLDCDLLRNSLLFQFPADVLVSLALRGDRAHAFLLRTANDVCDRVQYFGVECRLPGSRSGLWAVLRAPDSQEDTAAVRTFSPLHCRPHDGRATA